MSIAPSQNPLETYLSELITLTQSMITLEFEDVSVLESYMTERDTLVKKLEETVAASPVAGTTENVKALVAEWRQLDEKLEKRFLEIRSGLAKEIQQNNQTKKVASGYSLGQKSSVQLGIENEA